MKHAAFKLAAGLFLAGMASSPASSFRNARGITQTPTPGVESPIGITVSFPKRPPILVSSISGVVQLQHRSSAPAVRAASVLNTVALAGAQVITM
jgi:hypothetical protein